MFLIRYIICKIFLQFCELSFSFGSESGQAPELSSLGQDKHLTGLPSRPCSFRPPCPHKCYSPHHPSPSQECPPPLSPPGVISCKKHPLSPHPTRGCSLLCAPMALCSPPPQHCSQCSVVTGWIWCLHSPYYLLKPKHLIVTGILCCPEDVFVKKKTIYDYHC